MLKEVEQNQKFRNYFKYKSSKKNTATRGDDKREMIKKSLHEDSKMDENFEENEDQRTIQKFLLNLPGVCADDSMSY